MVQQLDSWCVSSKYQYPATCTSRCQLKIVNPNIAREALLFFSICIGLQVLKLELNQSALSFSWTQYHILIWLLFEVKWCFFWTTLCGTSRQPERVYFVELSNFQCPHSKTFWLHRIVLISNSRGLPWLAFALLMIRLGADKLVEEGGIRILRMTNILS